MDQPAQLSAMPLIRASYDFLPKAVVPGVMGTIVYTLLSLLAGAIRGAELFGGASGLLSMVPALVFGAAWFGLVFRIGLGLPRARFMLAMGKQEGAFAVSFLGCVFVLAIIGVLVGFLAFLLVMMISAIGGGALTGADVASAPIFETPEAFRVFLTGTPEGQVIGVLGLAVLFAAVFFIFWLVVRLSPFAAGAVKEERFVVLQAMSWTRYKDRPLMLAGLATLGVAVALMGASRIMIGAPQIPALSALLITNLIACFAVLIIVGFVSQVYLRTAGEVSAKEI